MSKELTAVEKARDAKRKYMALWRSQNRDKVKASQQKYWEKKYKESEKEC